MIAASAVLTPLAIVLLLIGMWRSDLTLTVTALAVSVAAMGCLAAAVYQRRAPLPTADPSAGTTGGDTSTDGTAPTWANASAQMPFPPLAPDAQRRRDEG